MSTYLGDLLRRARLQRKLSQDEVAKVLGMTRGNYGHMENGRRKDVLSPEQAKNVSRLLGVDMLELVSAMGFPVSSPGFQNQSEMRLLEEYRRLEPSAQRFLLRGLGIEE